MSLAKTEGSDKAIDRLANRMPVSAQDPIIPCCLARQCDAARFEHLEFQQQIVKLFRRSLVDHPLQHFAQDDVRQAKTLPIDPGVSTTARFVRAPLLRIASRISLSSISIFVRIDIFPMCKDLNTVCIPSKGEELPSGVNLEPLRAL